ncbi:hypothetical protein [Lysinibacillus fusiformis]|uniref:hypothetical protein n=1 Tax=Lysinibacillus fusiformis TaxID=28031 RepID=UPI00263B0DB6|nr:hypothetical protein [Lysinibacillus fusiformis]MDC6267280.1 hypothetical protein [Lysinibacillus sphaericus]MDN4968286.1 hypothetical protein [Lysinibacillus fusiformis]MDN4968460.1 hypothetical protein [Lysinibacillus fusiformis]
MDKKISRIFKYNVKDSSDQLLTFISTAKSEDWRIEDLISNVEWVAKEMQKQYEDNYEKFIKTETELDHMNTLVKSSLNNFLTTEDVDYEDNEDWLQRFLTTKI